MDYCIVYLSTATSSLSQAELTQLLQRSQRNNHQSRITGLLLYCNGSIIQVLEGEEQKVKALYEMICQDHRHKQIIKLYSQPIEHRSFSDWSMAYKVVSAKEFGHISELLPDPHVYHLPRENGLIVRMVRLFYENNYRN